MDLKEIRNNIDAIDTQICDLFKERMNLALEVAKEKEKNGTPVINKAREKEILLKISDEIGEPLDGYGRILFNTLFDLSRSYQNSYLGRGSDIADRIGSALKETPKLFPSKAVVACQGVRGSYSHAACEKLFELPDTLFFNSFEGVFNAVDKGLCQYGILPIENSSYGSVGAVYDLMRNYNFHIVKSLRLRINHNLMAKPGTKLSDVKEIFSHEQAIGQCGDFLKDLEGVKVTPCANTALAAKMVAESDRNDVAAISAKECLDLYGLELLKKAGNGGDIESYALLGLVYENAVGVERNIVEAAKWYELAAASGEPEFEVALAKIYLQELDGKELDIEKCLYYAKSAADKGHPEGAALYSFVSCTQLMKRKGILTGEEDADEIMEKVMQAAMDGDEDAIAFLA
jgi:chorismate mutase/prephenate dehydratase